jgi:hypothetical protein
MRRLQASPPNDDRNQIRTPYIKNGLRITGVFNNDVDIESTSVNNRNETVAWMAPNTENEIELTITEGRTGFFYHAWKMSGDDCPDYADYQFEAGSTEVSDKPSDFNHFKCCDFTMISQGMGNVKRLFHNSGDLFCNDTGFVNSITGSYPHDESPVTLCYTHGGGSYDTVVNPVCDIWRNSYNTGVNMMDPENPDSKKSEIKCRVGNQIKTTTAGGTVYGYKYTFPINSGSSGAKTTLKVVACSYQSVLPDAQISAYDMGPTKKVRMVVSPVFSMSYGSKQTDNACKNTDTTKCQDAGCLPKGVVNMLQDTSSQITSNDCTTFEAVRETDNPNFPFCARGSDCPSKSCVLTAWTKYFPYNESEVNVTLIGERNAQFGGITNQIACSHDAVTGVTTVTYNVTTTNVTTNVTTTNTITRNGCFGGAVCTDSSGVKLAAESGQNGTGTCQAPGQTGVPSNDLRCQTNIATTLDSKLKRLHQPQCTLPRLLSLAASAADVSDNSGFQIWPTFTENVRGKCRGLVGVVPPLWEADMNGKACTRDSDCDSADVNINYPGRRCVVGPYHVSIGTSNEFTIYARSNFKSIDVSFTTDGNNYAIPIGNRSAVIDFKTNEFKKEIIVDVKAMGWDAGLWVAKTSIHYKMIISRFDISNVDRGIQFKNPAIVLAVKKNFYGVAYTVDSPTLGKDLIVAKVGTENVKYFQTTRAALNNGEEIPALDDSKYWKIASGIAVSLRSCEDSVFLVQVKDRLLLSYQINATLDAPESVLTGTCSGELDPSTKVCDGDWENAAFKKVGSTARIVLDKNLVKKFCSPGSALQRAFKVDNTAGMLQGAKLLDIQLHADAGPFYLKGTLEVISRSPVLQQVQRITHNLGELTLTFPGPHRQTTGDSVTVNIPNKGKSKDEEVSVTVINSLQLKVRYTKPEHTQQFTGYDFAGADSPKKKVICYSNLRKVADMTMGPNPDNLGEPLTDFTIKLGYKLEQRSLNNGQVVGEGTVTVGNKGGSSTCVQAQMANDKAMVNSAVKVNRVYCGSAPCTYYCHGGSEQLSLNLGEGQYSTYREDTNGEVSFPTGASASLSGSELTVDLPTHSCARSGVKIGELSANGNEIVPICDPSQPGMDCLWLAEKVSLLKVLKVGKLKTSTNQEDYNFYILEGSVMAPFEAGELIPKSSGVLSKFNKIKFSAAGYYNDTHKPIMAPADVVVPPPDFTMPSITPSRSEEGVTRNDVDTTYMKSYNMRIIKMFNENAELTINNVQFQNAGISDDVDYNPMLVEHVENSAIQTTVTSATLDRMLLDPNLDDNEAGEVADPAFSAISKFCERPQPAVETVTGGIGKRHGGAIFFSGKLFSCTGCTFQNNRVTGNGGAIFVESPQPGRVIVDPDLDAYTDDSTYKERIDLQAAGLPVKTTFTCVKCTFEKNLAMSIARGPVDTFDTLTGGFGGAISIGLGVRYKRVVERAEASKVASVRRAFGSHGSMEVEIINGSAFTNNYAWKSGGALNALGGRTVAKKVNFKNSCK